MLSQMLQHEIDNRQISVREAARQIGISHTSVHRVLDDKNTDLGTKKAVAQWLGISFSSIIEAGEDLDTGVLILLQKLLKDNKALGNAFKEIVVSLEKGKIDTKDVEDILGYITYRLKIAKQSKNPGEPSDQKIGFEDL